MIARRKELVVVLLIAAMLVGVWVLASRVGTAQSGAETQYVYDAVHDAALTCYAVEGAYPDDIDYLRDNYGLAYDESRYMVSYDAFAINQVPAIFVTEVEADA